MSRLLYSTTVFKMKYYNYLPILFLCLFGHSTYAQKLHSGNFGKGVFNIVGKDSSWTMKVGLRMQILSDNSWNVEEPGRYAIEKSNFLIRRARLKFDGYAYSPKLKYKIELGLSNRDIGGVNRFTNNAPRYILDAVIKWNFFKNFSLWAGQTKLPGNRERVVSSGDLQFVDRSLLNKHFNIDRDVGLQLRHHFKLSQNFLVREIVSVSQGEGRNVTSGNLGGLQYTARIELLPFGKFKGKGDYTNSALQREKQPKLSIAATYNYNHRAVKDRGNMGNYMFNNSNLGLFETDISAVFVDAMFMYRGFSFMGEYANRKSPNPIAYNVDKLNPTGDEVKTGNSLNLQAGYLFQNNWELAARYTGVRFDRADALIAQYTFGVSKYIVGHKLKVQSDLSYTTEAGAIEGFGYRIQCDLHF